MGEIRELLNEVRLAYANQQKRLDFLAQMRTYLIETTDYRLDGEANGWAGHTLYVFENEGTTKQNPTWRREFESDEEAILWALRNPQPPAEEPDEDGS